MDEVGGRIVEIFREAQRKQRQKDFCIKVFTWLGIVGWFWVVVYGIGRAIDLHR